MGRAQHGRWGTSRRRGSRNGFHLAPHFERDLVSSSTVFARDNAHKTGLLRAKSLAYKENACSGVGDGTTRPAARSESEDERSPVGLCNRRMPGRTVVSRRGRYRCAVGDSRGFGVGIGGVLFHGKAGRRVIEKVVAACSV